MKVMIAERNLDPFYHLFIIELEQIAKPAQFSHWENDGGNDFIVLF